MRRSDEDFELRLSRLEAEWRVAYEASRAAGADFLALSASPDVRFAEVQAARRKLDEAEAQKAQIFAKIERFETIVTRRLRVNE
jgi:pyruvate kinase